MVSSRKLSSDEVEALIDGLQDQPATSGTSGAPVSEENVRPFDFGSDDLSLLGDYYALRMLNERLQDQLDQSSFLCYEYNQEFLRFHRKLKPLMSTHQVLRVL